MLQPEKQRLVFCVKHHSEETQVQKNILIERIMGTRAICLSSGSNASTLTAVDLGIVRLMAGALPSKAGEDSASFLR